MSAAARPWLLCVALAAACCASALALAQSTQGEADGTQAQPEGQPQPTEAAAPHARRYDDLRRTRPIHGDAEAGRARSEVCAACHGPAGISIAPTFPNLAGQRADFLYWQLVAFKSDPESPMAPLVADLGDEDMRNLAAYYASLAPAAGPEAPAEAAPVDPALVERGKALYMAGDPAKGIPPCQGCHGADARGHPDALVPDRNGRTPYAAFPALRGQQQAYLQTKLAEYRDGRHHAATTDFVMTGVGERLDDDSIQALSAWLSSLPRGQ